MTVKKRIISALALLAALWGPLTWSEPAVAAPSDRILIAYFTWADNTTVERPEEVDLDAVTSASLLPPGNTAKIAQWIHEVTGGDTFSIVTEEPYSSDYDICLEEASDQLGRRARPPLKGPLPDPASYDVIFLGYPNWWGTVPMALLSLLDQWDLAGKTVVPFCAHGTSRLGRSVRDLTAALPDSEILEALGVYRPETDRSQKAVVAWLTRLGFGHD